jgi:hypothetical protein
MPSDTFEQLEDGKRFKSYLKEKLFKNNVEQLEMFCNSLKNHNVLIAGGSVLAVHTTPPFESSDIDMYVHQSTGAAFIKDLLNLYDDIFFYTSFTRPVYDQSFLKRNNILYLIPGRIGRQRFDIMVTESDPIAVAGNFDLSCCQIFFNGHDVWATDFKEDKTCHLRKEYHKAWLAGSYFLKKRVRKYADRGFTITLEMNKELDSEPITNSDKKEKHISDYDEYIAIQTMTYILNRILRLSWKWEQPNSPLLKYNVRTGPEIIVKQKKLLVKILSQLFNIKTLNSTSVYKVGDIYNKFKKNQQYIHLYISVFYKYFYHVGENLEKINKHIEPIKETLKTKYNVSLDILLFYTLMIKNIDKSNIEKIRNDYDAKKKMFKKHQVQEQKLTDLLLEKCNTKIKQNLTIEDTATPITSDTKIFDFVQYDDINFDEDVDFTDIIVFRNNQFIFSFTRERFMSMITDKDNWFFECTRATHIGYRMEENRAMIYIKFPINKEGANGFFRINDIYALLSTPSNCFEIIQPDLICPVRTVSFKQTGPGFDNESANHCQHGTNILLFRFQALPSFTPPSSQHPPTTTPPPYQRLLGGCKQSKRKNGGFVLDKKGFVLDNKTYTFVEKKQVGGRLRNVYRSSRKLFVKHQGKIVSINDVKKKYM